MALNLYGHDFEYFGYSPDPGAPVASRHRAEFSDHSHAALAALAEYRAAETGPGRLAALDRIEQTPDIAGDPFTRSWCIYARLESLTGAPQDRLALIRGNIDRILSGPDYVRRIAAQTAAGQGEWALCSRIAAAAMQ